MPPDLALNMSPYSATFRPACAVGTSHRILRLIPRRKREDATRAATPVRHYMRSCKMFGTTVDIYVREGVRSMGRSVAALLGDEAAEGQRYRPDRALGVPTLLGRFRR